MTRRYRVLVGVLALFAVLSAVILFEVLGTVFFAVTVAYVLVPVQRRLVGRGMPTWWASVAATGLAFLSAAALLVPFAALLYRRRTDLLAVLQELPTRLTVDLFGVPLTVDAGVLVAFVRENLTGVAIGVAGAAPVLAIKAALFPIVVFALLVRRAETRRALLGPVPSAYHDVVQAFHERTRETLYAIYVLQAATAFGTFLIALPVFLLFGFEFAVTLALVAGFLQFLPIVGPSVLVALMGGYEVATGNVTGGVAFTAVGLLLVAWLPDVLIRPRLATETAHLPGSLYFVGFTGGLLSLGPIGFIAGPLVVALLAEAVELLAAENGSV